MLCCAVFAGGSFSCGHQSNQYCFRQRGPRSPESGLASGDTHAAHELSDQQTLEDLACLVTVSDILECLGCVLASYIEENLFTTTV